MSDITNLEPADGSPEHGRDELQEQIRRQTAELAAANARLRCEIADHLRMEAAFRQRENRYRLLFEDSPICLCEEDWSRVKDYFDSLRELGILDARAYFEDHPEAVWECLERVTIRDINKAALELLEAGGREELPKRLADLFTEETFQVFREELIALSEGRQRFRAETLLKTIRGKTVPVAVGLGVTPGCEQNLDRVLVWMLDLSDHKRAEEELRKEQRLLRQSLEIYERHRQMMAYDIHDAVAQPLTAALMTLEGWLALVRSGRMDLVEETFGRTVSLLRGCLDVSRRMMSGLRPPVLDEFGILPAVEQLVSDCRRQTAAAVGYACDVGFDRLTPPLETAVFRIIQESLNNACRYSRSDRIEVRLVQRDGLLEIHVEDWGVGFDPERVAPDRFGLEGLRQRAISVGGQAAIQSAPGGGTRIRVTFPVVERPSDEE